MKKILIVIRYRTTQGNESLSMLRISYTRILRVLEKTLRYVNKSAAGGRGGGWPEG